jgi:hypothetical protein
LNDSADDFSLFVWCENDENDESDDDDDNMKNAEIDRDDDSMNDFSEIDRRDFFRKRSFSERFHSSTDWSSIDDDFWLFWEWKNEIRCLIDWTDFVCDDRSRDDDSRREFDLRDSDRDFVYHE